MNNIVNLISYVKKKQIIVGSVILGQVFVLIAFFNLPPSITHFFKKPSSESTHRLNKIVSLTEQPIHWTVKDIEGKTVVIKGGFKSLVINLWATWCPPCIEELPSLSDLAEKLGQEGLVVALSTEPLDKVKRFIQTSFPDLSPHLRIVSVTEKERSRFFPADNLPVTYLFNQKGLLMEKVVGAKDWRVFPLPVDK